MQSTDNNVRQAAGNGSSAMPSVIISVSVIISCLILVSGFLLYKSTAGHSISATGSASVDFDSDLIVWRGSFSAHDDTAKQAYASIKQDATIVKKYLQSNGLSESEIVFNSVDITQRHNDTYDNNGNVISSVPDGYDLTQGIVITSSNIDAVEKISRDISSFWIPAWNLFQIPRSITAPRWTASNWT